ncbi:MAG: zinc ribbon domain-containing protein [Elusimicrobiota bacterium]
MDNINPSKIICKKCGYEPNIITDVCIKCGGEIVKICGKCGHENSVEKSRCDNCGELLALTPQKKIDSSNRKDDIPPKEEKKIKLEFEPINESVWKKDDSYRKENEKQKINAEEQKEVESKIKKTEDEKKKIEDYIKNSSFDEKNAQPITSTLQVKKDNYKKRIFIIIFSSLVVSIIASYLLFVRKSISRYELLYTAKKYLNALKERNYEKAYNYLSNNSKTIVSFTDYLKASESYYSKIGSWEFKDLKIYYFEENQSVIVYKLKEGDGQWRDDYLNFVKEHGVWTRPYVWNLFRDIDEAFSQRDFSKSLFLSQKLYLIDPLDPRSSGYLCWSEYFMRLYDKAIDSCRRVVELSAIYPIKYYNEEELFWYRFNYADSLRFTDRIEESIKIYDLLISNPDVPIKNKCSVFLARADGYVATKKYNSAMNDLASAISICEDGIEKKEAEKRISMLKGESCSDAIKYLKNYKIDGVNINDFIDSELKKTFDVSKLKYETEYVCNYLNGPSYKVEIRVKKSGKKRFDILRYEGIVNLWERTINIKQLKEE